MIHSFQPKVSDNRDEHTDRLDDVGNRVASARRCHSRSKKIVQPKNMHYVKVPQARSAKLRDSGIPTQGAIVQPVREINRLNSALLKPPSECASFYAAKSSEVASP